VRNAYYGSRQAAVVAGQPNPTNLNQAPTVALLPRLNPVPTFSTKRPITVRRVHQQLTLALRRGNPPLRLRSKRCQKSNPSAMVMPVNGKINIKLMNATNAVVTYQVIGDTNRTLAGGLDVTLQNIKTPLTVTFVREDKGLLKVSPKAASQGLLEVTLDESTNLDEDQDTVRVGGTVFIN